MQVPGIIEYFEFDLMVSSAATGGLFAQVVSSPVGEASTGFTLPFEPDDLHNMVDEILGIRGGRSATTPGTAPSPAPSPAVRRARVVGRPQRSRREIARILGSRLYEAVFAGEVGTAFRRSLDAAEQEGKGLRIRLRLADVPALAELPWECLYVEALGRFLALSRETPVVRYLGTPHKIPPLSVPPPLRVLLVVSAPVDLLKLNHDDEVTRIRSVLAGLIDTGQVVVTPLVTATLTELRRALRRDQYHILHFVGHGGYDAHTEEGGVVLEDDERRSRFVPGSVLGPVLHDHRSLRLVILNACEGARQSLADPFSGVAQSLVRQGVPAVVAMQFEITDDAARVFAEEFYSAIADRYPVDAAMAEARLALFEGDSDGEWATPVLYLRARDGQIFTEPADTGRAAEDYGSLMTALTNAPDTLTSMMRVREFRALIDDRTARFVGRDFIFRAIDEVLTGEDMASGYIVVRGEPGIGKTTVLAQLVKQRHCVHHFNSAPLGIVSSAAFLANVCAQLIVRYQLKHEILPAEATLDGGFLARLLDEVVEDPSTHPVLVVIDALDEAEDGAPRAGANKLYLPPNLPRGVYFVASTREEHDEHLFVESRRDVFLREEDPANIADVRAFVHRYIEDNAKTMGPRIAGWSLSEGEFVDVLTTRSEGNFMYLVHVLRDIRDGAFTATSIGHVDQLPRGLRDYYRRHWRDMRGVDAEMFRRYEEPVICLLAAVREPVQIPEILAWMRAYWERQRWTGSDLNPRTVVDVLNRWREFLNVEGQGRESKYRVYHASFQDFLREEVGLDSYHETIDDSALAKIPGFLTGP